MGPIFGKRVLGTCHNAFSGLPGPALEKLVLFLELDDAVALMLSGQVCAHAARKAVNDGMKCFIKELRYDSRRRHPVLPRPLPTTTVGRFEVCGLLFLGDMYPHERQYWWRPSTTRNELPSFVADAFDPDWKTAVRRPTTLCCELGYCGFYPVLDVQGYGGVQELSRFPKSSMSQLDRLVHDQIGGRNHHAGRTITCFVFYYSPYSVKSFAYVRNRIGELQALKSQDRYIATEVLEGQVGDQRVMHTERRRIPRFGCAPILLVELDGTTIQSLPASTAHRSVPMTAPRSLACRLQCPFLQLTTDDPARAQNICEAMQAEYCRMDGISQLRACVLPTNECGN